MSKDEKVVDLTTNNEEAINAYIEACEKLAHDYRNSDKYGHATIAKSFERKAEWYRELLQLRAMKAEYEQCIDTLTEENMRLRQQLEGKEAEQ